MVDTFFMYQKRRGLAPHIRIGATADARMPRCKVIAGTVFMCQSRHWHAHHFRADAGLDTLAMCQSRHRRAHGVVVGRMLAMAAAHFSCAKADTGRRVVWGRDACQCRH